MSDLPPNVTHPTNRTEWRDWLRENHARDAGVWMIRYKTSTGKPTLTYDDAVEEAICFGWIDSVPRKLDGQRTMLYFAPRKPGSGWSRLNKERVRRMMEIGAMTQVGQAKIDAAKADGSWTLLDDVENLIVPDDLAAAFAQHPGAAMHWEAFPRSVKRGILEWIQSAKRADTRRRRIDETAEKAARNERANQWRRS